MSFPNRDAQILAHILEYCNRIEKTLSRFGREFDVFLDDQDYMDSVSMNLLQIGELAGKFSDAYGGFLYLIPSLSAVSPSRARITALLSSLAIMSICTS